MVEIHQDLGLRAATDTNHHRAQQLRDFRIASAPEKSGIKLGDLWYAVPTIWAARLDSFLLGPSGRRGDVLLLPGPLRQHLLGGADTQDTGPGRVSLESIREVSTSGSGASGVRRDALENEHFTLVNAHVWAEIERYYGVDSGGGIACEVVPSGKTLIIEVRLLRFEVRVQSYPSDRRLVGGNRMCATNGYHSDAYKTVSVVTSRRESLFALKRGVLVHGMESAQTGSGALAIHVSSSSELRSDENSSIVVDDYELVFPDDGASVFDESHGLKDEKQVLIGELPIFDDQTLLIRKKQRDTLPIGSSLGNPNRGPQTPAPPPPPPPPIAFSGPTASNRILPPPPPPLSMAPVASGTPVASGESSPDAFLSLVGVSKDDMITDEHSGGDIGEPDAVANGSGAVVIGNPRIGTENSRPHEHQSTMFESVRISELSPRAGLQGLSNLGNTCFMNSALQCLSNTAVLSEYFLSASFLKDLNRVNPLGMQGELALEYNKLLRQLWLSPDTSASSSRYLSGAVAPRSFKLRMAHWAPQFSGYYQHDAQELLAYLLDALHEDLNRVLDKPYVESVERRDGESDGFVALESWRRHKLRHDSLIVDMFQGQYRSTVVCPQCGKVSVTFDPFMYLTLPIPSATERKIAVLLVSQPALRTASTASSIELGVLRSSKFDALNAGLEMDHAARAIRHKRQNDEDETAGVKVTPRPLKFAISVPVTAGCVRDVRSKLALESGVDAKNLVFARLGINRLYDVPLPDSASVESCKLSSVGLVAYEMADVGGHHVLPSSKSGSDQEPVDTDQQDAATGDDDLNSGDETVLVEIVQRVVSTSGMQETGSCIAVPQLTSIRRNELSGELLREQVFAFVRRYFQHNRYQIHQQRCDSFSSSSSSSSTDQRIQQTVNGSLDRSSSSPPPPVIASVSSREHSTKSFRANGPMTRAKRRIMFPFILRLLPHSAEDSMDVSSGAVSTSTKRALSGAITEEVEIDPSSNEVILLPNSASWVTLTVEWCGGRPFEESFDRDECALKAVDVHQTMHAAISSEMMTYGGSLARNARREQHSLYDCLRLWGETETLSEDNAWFCSSCRAHQRAKKSLRLWRAPPVLIVHIKRFSYSTWHRHKLDAMVDFPLEVLDLSHYVGDEDRNTGENGGCEEHNEPNSPGGKLLYDLYAISNHYGGLGGGHYTAFARRPWKLETNGDPVVGEVSPDTAAALEEGTDWYHFDDSMVTKVDDVNELRTSAAYVLFYRART